MKTTAAPSPRGTNNERPMYGVDVPSRPLSAVILLRFTRWRQRQGRCFLAVIDIPFFRPNVHEMHKVKSDAGVTVSLPPSRLQTGPL